MNIIFLLIIASFTLAFGFLMAFIWAMKKNQFEDTYTPAIRILLDDNDKKIDLKQN